MSRFKVSVVVSPLKESPEDEWKVFEAEDDQLHSVLIEMAMAVAAYHQEHTPGAGKMIYVQMLGILYRCSSRCDEWHDLLEMLDHQRATTDKLMGAIEGLVAIHQAAKTPPC